MATRRDSILREMGLAPLWRLRQRPALAEDAVTVGDSAIETPADSTPAAPGDAQGDARARRIAAMDWETLATTVAGCRDCRLCEQRKQAVFGVGDVAADWLFVGEGPGAEEDERGEPFVGQAGKLLDAMLAAIGLRRGRKVYIANVVKCRPPGNRTPQADETAACFPYLQRQIELIAPKLIVALGKPAAETLLGTEVRIGASRGRLFDCRGIPLVVTYHPAYLLRNLPDKAKAWEDLCFARRVMKELDVADGQ
ncbi:MAG TPA: uracil-DNA glycosylase [Candidatus Desulfobacillus sp.]|nr:uracil-DNA glycosylase [Candidatus Desulfobacillus sp.]